MVTASGSVKLEELSQRRLVAFERRYGRGALNFACHAAFPLTLTTDLSYCLRETFFPDAPWHWAAEVLLSGLCSPAGYDLYEMEGATRKALLYRLLERFEEPRLWRLDQFMKAYLKHRLDVKPLEADRLWLLGDRPHWTALACLRPDEAFAAIQQELQQLVTTDDFQDRFRLAALIESYADLLTQKNFRPVLLEYAKRARAGEPIDPTATTAAAARQAGFPLERLEFDVVTIAFEDQVTDFPDDALRPFDFETVTVNQRGEVVERSRHQAFYFLESLSPNSDFDTSNGINTFNANRPSTITVLSNPDDITEGIDDSDDVIKGQAGNDTLQGLGGNDVLRGGLGDDLLIGEEDRVLFHLSSHGFVQVNPDNHALALQMVAIPAGEFWMGSPENEPQRYDDESPQHLVRVPPFFISKYPVTQAQWQAVAALPEVERSLKAQPSRFQGDNRPVERVSWHEAVEFCARLSRYTGREYRLPTEAEWEYACRAGTRTPFYCGETITSDLANFNAEYTYADAPKGEYRQQTTDVGMFPPNAFGLYDMHGNVREWCLDPWHSNYEGAPTDGSAWVDETSSERASYVTRGGSWDDNPRTCRSAYRYNFYPGVRYFNIGFRVVCVPPRTL